MRAVSAAPDSGTHQLGAHLSGLLSPPAHRCSNIGTAPVHLSSSCRLCERVGAGPVSREEGPFSGVATNETLQLRELTRLYRKYGAELAGLRAPARDLCAALRSQDRSFCASDDVESEITYMRVREASPAKVLELSPRAGYSSFFLLAAQRATGQGGLVHSYDLEDVLQRANLSAALRRLPYTPFGTPSGLRASEHWLHVGDARLTLPERLDAGGGAPSFGYLFFDSAHTQSCSQNVQRKQLV